MLFGGVLQADGLCMCGNKTEKFESATADACNKLCKDDPEKKTNNNYTCGGTGVATIYTSVYTLMLLCISVFHVSNCKTNCSFVCMSCFQYFHLLLRPCL